MNRCMANPKSRRSACANLVIHVVADTWKKTSSVQRFSSVGAYWPLLDDTDVDVRREAAETVWQL